MNNNSNDGVVILSGVRTPIGAFCGSLSSLKAHELGSIVIQEALARASVEPDQVTEVIFGNVLTAGQGQNPARQAAVKAGIPHSVPSTLVNMLCGSGLRSVILGAQAIQAGDADVIVAGGQESMSQAHHSMHMRTGIKMGPGTLTDTMIQDGLTDAFSNIHMGITAENIAKQWKIAREDQDKFALFSQQKTAVAQKEGAFKEEIVPVTIKSRKGEVKVEVDEFPKNDTTLESLTKLRPAFVQDGTGTVTAGNASGLNDGAAAIVLCSESLAKANKYKPIARIVSYASAGVDPNIMGTGPIPAIRSALKKATWSNEDVDLFEVNEAFAAQSLQVVRELGLDASRVNIRGGAIALGHPIGASGARVLVTLIHALKHTGGKRGVAGLCIGGGMGIAMCIEMI